MNQLQLPEIPQVRRLRIVRDIDPMNPRKEWDNLGHMVCWHRNYDLGDEQPTQTPGEYRLALAEKYHPGLEERLERECERMRDAIGSPWGSRQWLQAHQEVDNYAEARVDRVLAQHIIELPLYLYDHSGTTMSTGAFSCPWDSGKVGFIYIDREKIKAEYGWKVLTTKRREQLEKYLRNEVQTYDQYLTGEVYGLQIETQDNETGEWEETDACWGFFGEDVEGVYDYAGDFTLEQVKVAFADPWLQGSDGVWVQNTTGTTGTKE